MSTSTQSLKIKCPHCGWVRTITFNVSEGETTIIKGWTDDMRKAVEGIRRALTAAQRNETNDWIDMPKCPHCGKVYRYNARTGEVTP